MQDLTSTHKENKTGTTNLQEELPFISDGGCTLLLCTKGRAVISTNTQKRTFINGDLLLLFSNMLFAPFKISATFSAEYIYLSQELMEEIFYKMTSEKFWEGVYSHPVLRLSAEQYQLVQGLFMHMKWAMKSSSDTYQKTILQNSTYNLFLAIDTEFKKASSVLAQNSKKDKARMLFGKFMSLLIKHYHERRDVKFYADKLCVTTNYLYKVTDKVEQQTPKEVIDTFILTEIKKILNNTDLSIKDLAFLFHFDDASYLCRFFRRMTGCSISEYRNRI